MRKNTKTAIKNTYLGKSLEEACCWFVMLTKQININIVAKVFMFNVRV